MNWLNILRKFIIVYAGFKTCDYLKPRGQVADQQRVIMKKYSGLITVLFGCLFCYAAYADERVSGQYVHVVLPGDGKTLSLAEVEVFSGGFNVALKKKTIQSSVGHGGDASRAVDGDVNGDYNKGSITHSAEKTRDPQWEVDLGRVVPIEKITIWNRDGYEERLDGARVLVLDANRKVVWGRDIGKGGKGAEPMMIKTKPVFMLFGTTIAKVVKK